MKKKKSLVGTYIKCIIALIIIGALIFLGFKIFSKGYSKEKFETVKTNMLLIKGKTEVISQKVEIKEKGAKYIGTKIEEKENDEKVQKLINDKVIDIDSKKSKYYYLEKSNVEELGLSINLDEDDIYIVDYKKNDIIYANGIKNSSGNTIYKLSDME